MNILIDEPKCIDSYRPLDPSILSVGRSIPFHIFFEQDGVFHIRTRRGTILSKLLLNDFKTQNNLYTLKKELTCKTLPAYIKQDINDTKENIKYLYQINNRVFESFLSSKDDRLDLYCVKAIVDNIIYLIKNNKNFLKDSIELFVNEKKLASHSLHVTVYSLCIANILGFRENELIQLGISALLHDVGKKKIDDELMDKEELSMVELETIHNHVLRSIEVIKHNEIYDPYILEAVTHHHERYDGSGYPNGLVEKNISQFASILGICDEFDSITSDNAKRKAMSTFEALKTMIKDPAYAEKFNSHYLALFVKAV